MCREIAGKLTVKMSGLSQEAGNLSGGNQQQVVLCKWMMKSPKLLILDEPFRGLDEALKRRIIDRMWEAETQGKTVLLITHRPEDSETLAQRTLTL